MTIKGNILDFAFSHTAGFSRKELMGALASGTGKVSESSVYVALTRLVNDGKLIRAGYGRYLLNGKLKPEYNYSADPEILEFDKQIKAKFPFIDCCVWRSSALTPFMRHVPAVDIIFIDVERDVMESMFFYLQSLGLNTPVLLHPSKNEMERYVTNKGCVIIRPLIQEAPLQKWDRYSVPALEKLLVDAAGDKELEYLRGNELYYIFQSAFAEYNVNTKRLLRYASRRNRKVKIQEILNNINL